MSKPARTVADELREIPKVPEEPWPTPHKIRECDLWPRLVEAQNKTAATSITLPVGELAQCFAPERYSLVAITHGLLEAGFDVMPVDGGAAVRIDWTDRAAVAHHAADTPCVRGFHPRGLYPTGALAPPMLSSRATPDTPMPCRSMPSMLSFPTPTMMPMSMYGTSAWSPMTSAAYGMSAGFTMTDDPGVRSEMRQMARDDAAATNPARPLFRDDA